MKTILTKAKSFTQTPKNSAKDVGGKNSHNELDSLLQFGAACVWAFEGHSLMEVKWLLLRYQLQPYLSSPSSGNRYLTSTMHTST